MLATLALTAVLFQQEGNGYHDTNLSNGLFVRTPINRLDPPKRSPKRFQNNEPWEFDWVSQGYATLQPDDKQSALRFRVFSQERKQSGDKAPMVARMALRMWDRVYHRLKYDHRDLGRMASVDFYLCFGGPAGGEQLFGQEIVPNQANPFPVNTIYIYQLSSFKDPTEEAREVAHEYGHAVLPPIGGFKQPEVWADGYLGEKLFLKWMRNDMLSGALTPDDAMGANANDLSVWLSKNLDPLVQRAATAYPDGSLINESKGGMDAFNGLAMYIEALCPPAVFARSLSYTSDAQKGKENLPPPTDYPDNVLTAASEMESLTLSVPQSLFDSKASIWIPLGKGSVHGATILTRKGGWAQVAPLQRNIVIKNPALR